ncbi:MAG TPA: hypothetical protein VNJ07_01785 [Chitinophagales bacterium]|nr:hypothetical protein [Chitinophagales bacterium]
MDKQFNLIAVIEAAQKWFKPIAIISALVFVGAYVVTHPRLHILPLKYESHTVIFPANLSMTDRPYLFESSSAVDVELEMFGDKHDVDRFVSIAQSGQVLAHLVEKYNLIEHYKIKKEKVKYPFTAAIDELKKNYRAFKNEFGGAEIWMMDKDRELAAEMANEAVAYSDRINRNMLLEGRKNMMNIIESHTRQKQKELDELTAQIAQATPEQKKIMEIKQVLAAEQLAKYSNILDQYKLITAQDFTTVHVMEKAYPAEKETSSRWFIIMGAFLVTLFALVSGATVLHMMSR